MLSLPTTPSKGTSSQATLTTRVWLVVLIAIVICAAALAGVYSRPMGFLATFWPANSILAGLLVRARQSNRLLVLVGALIGYEVTGFIAGDPFWLGLQMTAANMVGAVTFAFVFCSLETRDRDLTRARAVLSFIGSAIIAAVVAGVAGGPSWASMGNSSYFDGWRTWFSSELMNYLVLLPGILALPWPLPRPRFTNWSTLLRQPVVLPTIALLASVGFGILVANPVAIVFPVAALIWCALVVPLPLTCLLVPIYSGATMFAVKLGGYGLGATGLSEELIAAVHLGVAMIALGPVLVASATADRRRQFAEVERAATYDSLTDALNRGAFLSRTENVLAGLRDARQPVSVILFDVDHFKQVNDAFGHAAGDLALISLSAVVRASIRNGDMFGRLGGEEFALLLPGAGAQEALAVANRLRRQVERLRTALPSGDVLEMTISVGVATSHTAQTAMSEMLSFADQTMYEAKHAGRNRVEFVEMPA